MKKEKLVSGILAIAGFLLVSSLIISACHRFPVQYWVYGLISSLIILLNVIILLAWVAFGEWGLWIFIALSSVITLFVSLVTNTNITTVVNATAAAGISAGNNIHTPNMNMQILIFFAVGLFVTIFKNSMVTRALSIDRQIDTLEEEKNAIEAEYAYTKGANDALKEKVVRYATLKELTSKLSSTLSLDSVVNIVIDNVCDLVEKADACILFLVDEEARELALKAVRGKEGAVSVKSKKGDIFDIWVLKQRQPLMVSDADKDFRFNLDLIPVEFRRGFKSLIAAPLISEKKVIGILRVESREAEAYISDDLRLLTIISDLAAIALENSKLYHRIEELAISDGLTGLYCQRYFKERMAEDIVKAVRIKQPLSLLMFDIDGFKGYNDKYGHIAGDIVLKSIGGLLKGSLEPGDIAARYGGEEFVIVLFGKDKAAAQRLGEEVRKKIEGEKFILRQVETHVTVSIGCAGVPEDAVSRDEIIRSADAALYEAKKNGGNKVCLA
ncbi:MAG: sensor domain-containing diguanylate cyclase [Candidatus Omnitrophica bacterium]|nr:sensor domain-containing diguanylate cyclase [Candidatus Omnitrophota bacterium]MDD5310531.1 sensor domain-containing diguanylate cyclase [Candidatus Omnitrophota bacterium]MDD5546043.1 sensor domain-containing diguanylate cyclase [Candidatus Omnitrophota bacterium]